MRQSFPQEASPAIYRSCWASCIGLPFFDKGCVVAESLGRWVSLLLKWMLSSFCVTNSREKHTAEPVQFGTTIALEIFLSITCASLIASRSFGGTTREVQCFSL